MAPRPETRRDATDSESDAEQDVPTLCLHETRPGRKVLTEEDNTDGWIASDLTVEVRE
jgi:hypothetical protein